MTKSTWAGLGALAVLLALPATAPAMGEGTANQIRTRRVTAVQVTDPSPMAVGTATGSHRREVVILATDRVTPAMPTMEETMPETLDLSLESASPALSDSETFFAVDASLARPALSSELQAIIRREVASLYCLDVELTPAP